ncbi:MAG: Crp/Fnr family transcriptional regulator [Bacteroidales bacterium]|nr:Crp/Fnr family transcriptional regulator [Bacteroidales bacterium]
MMEVESQLFDCNKCAFKTISCHYIGDDEFEIIRQLSVQLQFEKGETIVKQGSKSTHLIFLHKGILKFTYHNQSGKNFIMTIVAGPKLLGGANLFFKNTNIFSLVAIEKCDICLIDERAFKNTLVKHGNYLLILFEKTIEMFQSSIFNFISLAHQQVNGRIADILIYLSEEVYKNQGYEFTLSRKEIAEFAACSHENVITTLSKLNKEGTITLVGKKIIINDLNKLKEISKRS